MITVESISKIYKKRTVVDDISFSIQQGEIVGLLGPNGAGKTTCFYMILGLVSTDHGKIYLQHQDITLKPVHFRAKLGLSYLPQEPSIFRKLSVKDNIMAILELNKKLNLKQRKDKLQQLLTEFNISHIANSLGISLSGGERRRVEIARTLATDPKFIFLDEPFAGVDPISIIDIKNIIRHLASKNIGIIITDHNVRETLDICHTANIMNSGKLIATGDPKDIVNNALVKEVYLGEDWK